MLFNSPLLTTWQRSEKIAFISTSLVSLFLPFSFCHCLLSPLPAARRCSTPPVSYSHLIISLTWTLSRDSSLIKPRCALLLPAHSLPHCSGHTLQDSGLDWWHYLPLTDTSTTFRSWLPLLPLSLCSDNIAGWVSPSCHLWIPRCRSPSLLGMLVSMNILSSVYLLTFRFGSPVWTPKLLLRPGTH